MPRDEARTEPGQAFSGVRGLARHLFDIDDHTGSQRPDPEQHGDQTSVVRPQGLIEGEDRESDAQRTRHRSHHARAGADGTQVGSHHR